MRELAFIGIVLQIVVVAVAVAYHAGAIHFGG